MVPCPAPILIESPSSAVDCPQSRGQPPAEETKGKTVKVLKKYGPTALALALGVTVASATVNTDPNAVLIAVDTATTTVMGLCVTIGTFFGVFKVVKWIRR